MVNFQNWGTSRTQPANTENHLVNLIYHTSLCYRESTDSSCSYFFGSVYLVLEHLSHQGLTCLFLLVVFLVYQLVSLCQLEPQYPISQFLFLHSFIHFSLLRQLLILSFCFYFLISLLQLLVILEARLYPCFHCNLQFSRSFLSILKHQLFWHSLNLHGRVFP